jgi:predicted DNA-binding transcriptional regulator
MVTFLTHFGNLFSHFGYLLTCLVTQGWVGWKYAQTGSISGAVGSAGDGL